MMKNIIKKEKIRDKTTYKQLGIKRTINYEKMKDKRQERCRDKENKNTQRN